MSARSRGLWVLSCAAMLGALSAGAQDTVHVKAEGPPLWGVRPAVREVLRIGQLDGPPEYAFGSIGSVAVDPTGAFYVYDERARQIRRYDAQGRFTLAVGRRGRGPGEYEQVAAMSVTRDSLLVISDPNNARISYFGPDGRFRRSWTVPRSAFYGQGALSDVADRVYIQVPLAGGPAEGEGARNQLVRFRDGQPVDSLPVPPLQRNRRPFYLSTTDGLRASFVETTLWTPHATGGLVTGHSTLLGFVLDTGRGPIRRVARSGSPVRVEPQERAEWEAMGEFLRRRDGRSQRYEIPSAKPLVRALQSDDRGRVWVEVYVAAERRTNIPPRPPERGPLVTWRERTTFEVFTGSGAYLGRVALPAAAQWLTASGDRLWFKMAGPDGEELVVVWQLPPTRG